MKFQAGLLVMVLFLAAGCTSTPTSQLATTTDDAGHVRGVCVDKAIRPVDCPSQNVTGMIADNATRTPPKPVDIAYDADLTQAGSTEFAWGISPGISSFTVSVVLSGMSGAPAFVDDGFGYHLAGGQANKTYADRPTLAPGAGVILGFGEVARVAFDGSRDATADNLAGPWKLGLVWQPSATHLAVRVTAHY